MRCLHVDYMHAWHAGGPVPSVEGSWRLVFGTATKIRVFQYIPVKEDFIIDLEKMCLALESELGPFEFHVKGVIHDWDAGSGALEFQFNAVDILLLGRKVGHLLTAQAAST
eukprot:jgi/Chrzof1/10833/Cz05g13240.t1